MRTRSSERIASTRLCDGWRSLLASSADDLLRFARTTVAEENLGTRTHPDRFLRGRSLSRSPFVARFVTRPLPEEGITKRCQLALDLTRQI